MTCHRCGRELSANETGLSRKLISRATRVFLCFDCLGAEYRLTREQMLELIAHFKATGCTLFP